MQWLWLPYGIDLHLKVKESIIKLMGQKGFTPIVILVALVIGSLAFGGYWFLNQQRNNDPLNKQIILNERAKESSQPVGTRENITPITQELQKTTIDESLIVYDSTYPRPQNKLSPSLKINDTINFEGVLNDLPLLFQGNNYEIKTASSQPYDACFFYEGNLPVLSIINANIEIPEPIKLGCTKTNLKDYKVKYTHEQIKSLLNEFVDECIAIEDLQNKRGLTKLPLKMSCKDIAENEGHYPRYQWDQVNQKLLVHMYADVSDLSNSNSSEYDCSKSTVEMVIDPTQRKLDKVYIGKFESITCVND